MTPLKHPPPIEKSCVQYVVFTTAIVVVVEFFVFNCKITLSSMQKTTGLKIRKQRQNNIRWTCLRWKYRTKAFKNKLAPSLHLNGSAPKVGHESKVEWFNSQSHLLVAYMDIVLCCNYLCLVKSRYAALKKSEAELKYRYNRTLSKSRFVPCITPLSLSCDRSIKVKHQIICSSCRNQLLRRFCHTFFFYDISLRRK